MSQTMVKSLFHVFFLTKRRSEQTARNNSQMQEVKHHVSQLAVSVSRCRWMLHTLSLGLWQLARLLLFIQLLASSLLLLEVAARLRFKDSFGQTSGLIEGAKTHMEEYERMICGVLCG